MDLITTDILLLIHINIWAVTLQPNIDTLRILKRRLQFDLYYFLRLSNILISFQLSRKNSLITNKSNKQQLAYFT